jgi:hypothetical protein
MEYSMFRIIHITLFLGLLIFTGIAHATDKDDISTNSSLVINPIFSSNKGDVYGLSLSLVNHVDGSFKGVQAGGILNMVRKDMKGLQVGGFFNLVERNMVGVQLSWGINYVGGNFRGIQFTSGINMVVGKMAGIQAGGLLAVTLGGLSGIQVSGFMNFLSGTSYALQLAPFANINVGKLHGLQVAFLFNYSAFGSNVIQVSLMNISYNNKKGLQAGILNIHYGKKYAFIEYDKKKNIKLTTQQRGLVNFSKSYISQQGGYFSFANKVGMQSGLLNVARRVEYGQVGLINLAYSSNGFALGLFSLAMKNGGISYEGWADSKFNSYSSIKFRHTYTYSALVFNNHLDDGFNLNKSLIGVGYIWGIHLEKGRFYMESDFGTIPSIISKTAKDESLSCRLDFDCKDETSLNLDVNWEIRAKIGYRVLPHLSIVAGANYNFSKNETALTAGFSILQ